MFRGKKGLSSKNGADTKGAKLAEVLIGSATTIFFMKCLVFCFFKVEVEASFQIDRIPVQDFRPEVERLLFLVTKRKLSSRKFRRTTREMAGSCFL